MTGNRLDSTHTEFLNAWRTMGLSVIDMASITRQSGFDALISNNNVTATIEIKDGSLPPSRRKYSECESQHARMWKGLHALVETLDEAIEVGRALTISGALDPTNHPTWGRLRRLDRCTPLRTSKLKRSAYARPKSVRA